MIRTARFWGLTAICAAIIVFADHPVNAGADCPDLAENAERFILVLSSSMTSPAATVQYFEKLKDGSWHTAGTSKDAVLGRNGLGWSWAFRHYASAADPIKKEGDKRTPAGFFSVGEPFGFSTGKGDEYVRLTKNQHFCVDDPASPLYNRIVTKAEAGKGVSGEDMAAISLYREGLFLNYPTSRKQKGGSCIFIHVWRHKNANTVGCVALSEDNVKDLQSRSARRASIVGILPQNAWEKLKRCFLKS